MSDPAADPGWYLDNVVIPGGEPRRRLGQAAEWQTYWRTARHALCSGAEPIAALAAEQGFVVSATQVRASGVQPRTVRSRIRRGEWWRPARGVVAVLPDPLLRPETADPFVARRRHHTLRATAQALVRPDHVISGASAAVLAGLPVTRLPELPVFTTRRDPTEGRRSRVHLRSARLAERDVERWFGVAVTAVPRTVVDLARLDEWDGIMAADAALREGLATRADLRAAAAGCAGWPGARAARDVVAMADARAESPLESVTRLVLCRAGLPTPELQVPFEDPVGGRTYRVDLLFRDQGLVVEADGRTKYTGDELWQEKRRELALSRLGLRVERVTWADLTAHRQATMWRLSRYFLGSCQRR